MNSYLLLMMGGTGTRLGENIPKQYIEVEGQPVFSYILAKYDTLDCIKGMIIVSHPDWIDFVQEWADRLKIKKLLKIAPGGATRSNSVLNGLEALRRYAEAEDCVLIHDATHPYVDKKGTEECIQAIAEYGGATLAEYQYDTVYRLDENDFVEETLQRRYVVAGASPEGFNFGKLYSIYKNATQEELERMTSAGAIANANGIRMKAVPANVINLKITYKNDMIAFNKIVHSYFFEEKQE